MNVRVHVHVHACKHAHVRVRAHAPGHACAQAMCKKRRWRAADEAQSYENRPRSYHNDEESQANKGIRQLLPVKDEKGAWKRRQEKMNQRRQKRAAKTKTGTPGSDGVARKVSKSQLDALATRHAGASGINAPAGCAATAIPCVPSAPQRKRLR